MRLWVRGSRKVSDAGEGALSSKGDSKGYIDAETFDAVYRRFAPSVYHVAQSILGDDALAEDVTHDVFLTWLKAPERFDGARGTLGAYLLVMARSRALDELRRKRRERTLVVSGAYDAAHVEADDWERAERRLWAEGARTLLASGLNELSDAERTAVIGHYALGFSHRALSEALGRPLGTVKSQLRSGIARLRRRFAQGGWLSDEDGRGR